MEIGDLVTYNGERFVLRGLEPMSVDDRCAQILDPRTGEVLLVPLDELEPGGFGEMPRS